jgi:hypothetical protein
LLFANLQGYKIGVKVEMPKDKEQALPSQSARDRAEDDDETDDRSRSETHWKRIPPKEDGRDKYSAGGKGELPQDQGPTGKQHHSQQVEDVAPQEKPQQESIYTFKKGYYKVSARKLRGKQICWQ